MDKLHATIRRVEGLENEVEVLRTTLNGIVEVLTSLEERLKDLEAKGKTYGPVKRK